MTKRQGSGKVYTDPEEYMKAFERGYQEELKRNYEKIKKRGRPPKNPLPIQSIQYKEGEFIIDFE